MPIDFSVVGSRRRCKLAIKRVGVSEEYGVVSNVSMKRIGLGVWVLTFTAEKR